MELLDRLQGKLQLIKVHISEFHDNNSILQHNSQSVPNATKLLHEEKSNIWVNVSNLNFQKNF